MSSVRVPTYAIIGQKHNSLLSVKALGGLKDFPSANSYFYLVLGCAPSRMYGEKKPLLLTNW